MTIVCKTRTSTGPGFPCAVPETLTYNVNLAPDGRGRSSAVKYLCDYTLHAGDGRSVAISEGRARRLIRHHNGRNRFGARFVNGYARVTL